MQNSFAQKNISCLLLGTLITAIAFPASRTAQAVEAADLLVVGGFYFDSEQGDFFSNRGLAVQDGRILGINVDPAKFDAKRKLQLDSDQFVLPGFIDLHAHYNVRLFKKRREEFEVMPVVYLANGATTTFSAGEYDPEGMYELRERISSGKQIGPNLLTSGPYFGSVRPGWGRGGRAPQDIRDDVHEWAARGVAGFKAKGIRYKELEALIEAAHQHHLTVTGHLGSGYRGSVNPRDAILLGIDRVEHFLGGDAISSERSAYDSLQNLTPEMPEVSEIIRLYIEKDVWFDATISAYGYFGATNQFYERWIDEEQFFTPYVRKELQGKEPTRIEQFEKIFQVKRITIKALYDAGGKITLGTDHCSNGEYLPGFGVHRELHVLVESGIPAAKAIEIGTLNGAKAMGIESDFGSLEEGKVADLYIVRGNPLDDIRNTREGIHVIRRGEVHDPRRLLQSVQGKLGPKDASERDRW